jgi:D-glycero-D-manno-heptose 1,7-bisphosphate phosphatase
MLYIFDKDGTLVGGMGNRPANTPDEQKILPGVAEKISELREQGHKIAIVSNQGGVAWGFISYEQAIELMRDCERKIGGADAADFAPWDSRAKGKPNAHPRFSNEPELESEMRKPAPGMIINIMGDLGFSPDETIMVGDMESDQQAATNAGCSFVWAKDFFGW